MVCQRLAKTSCQAEEAKILQHLFMVEHAAKARHGRTNHVFSMPLGPRQTLTVAVARDRWEQGPYPSAEVVYQLETSSTRLNRRDTISAVGYQGIKYSLISLYLFHFHNIAPLPSCPAVGTDLQTFVLSIIKPWMRSMLRRKMRTLLIWRRLILRRRMQT